MTQHFIVRRTSAADWQSVRALRLEMLADTPLAYGETMATALSRQEPEWRVRAARGDGPGTTAVAAIELSDDESAAAKIAATTSPLNPDGMCLVIKSGKT